MTSKLIRKFQSNDVVALHAQRYQLLPRIDGAMIHAQTDPEAISAWLANFADSPRTLANYRKEVERLLLWARLVKGMHFGDLRHEDFIEFRKFLAAPPDTWISATKYPRLDEHWRPFSKALSPASIRQAEIVCNTFFNWLVEGLYLRANPLALVKRRTHAKQKSLTRFLSGVQVAEILQTVSTIEDPRKRARCRWVFTLLYLTMGRIGEVVDATMGDIHLKPTRTGSLWWLRVLGKGRKEGEIPVTDELLEELKAYRLFNGLRALPEPKEATPLILRLEGDRSKPLTQSMLHNIIKDVVKATSERLKQEGNIVDAESIGRASAHWLRHSAASALSYDVDMPTLRDFLRHENVSTTSIYAHTEDENQHSSLNRNHKIPTGN